MALATTMTASTCSYDGANCASTHLCRVHVREGKAGATCDRRSIWVQTTIKLVQTPLWLLLRGSRLTRRIGAGV